MSRLAHALSTMRRLLRTRTSSPESGPDRPASFAEIVAASAFLDFGGMPSGDWLHAWEASAETDRRLADQASRREDAARQSTTGNKRIGEGGSEEKTVFDPRRSQHVAHDFADRDAAPFRTHGDMPMVLVDKPDGLSSMHPDTTIRTLDLAMCVAAFGFVAAILMFAHPASPTNRPASTAATATASGATTSEPNATTLSRLTAPH